MSTRRIHARSHRAATRAVARARQVQGQPMVLRGHRLLAAHSSARR